mgnify:CR=1 FL=1
MRGPGARSQAGQGVSVSETTGRGRRAETVRALVVGAGPAGLMAAEVLSEAGVSVVVADQMPTPARKFLMAGKSGLNLTKVGDGFEGAYGEVSSAFARAVAAFGPQEVMRWAEGLGQEVFVGSTGRVFPVAMKASPLLRAWLGRLDGRGVALRTRWRWAGWRDGRAVFDTPEGPREIDAEITVLAMGGASWRRLGSDGEWSQQLPDAVAPFLPANVGLRVDWSAHMARWHGEPLKGVAFHAGDVTSRGEAVVTTRGLEGGGVYSVSAGTLFNVTMGGLSLFALAWTYFDCAGNEKPKSRTSAVLLRYWFAHIVILWSAVTIGVALAGEVYVGLWEPYPPGYAALGSVGLAVFLASLWALRRTVADATDKYHSAGLRLFGIVMALVVLAVHPLIPSIVSNGLWALALFSQIGVPIFLAVSDARRSDKIL